MIDQYKIYSAIIQQINKLNDNNSVEGNNIIINLLIILISQNNFPQQMLSIRK